MLLCVLLAFRAAASALATIAMIWLVLFSQPAEAGRCLKDVREVKLEGTRVLRLRDYLCRGDAAAELVSVRVQFLRLNSVAASALLSDRPIPALAGIFGPVRLVRNETALEFQTLLDRFGESVASGSGYQLQIAVETPPGGTGTPGETELHDDFDLKSLSLVSELLLAGDIAQIRRQTTWPKGFRFYYTPIPTKRGAQVPYDVIQGTTLWRFVTGADIATHVRDLTKFNTTLGSDGRAPELPASLRLIQYLTKDRMPADFLLVSGHFGEHGDGNFSFGFGIFGRAILLDVAVIENVSNAEISLEGLLGSETARRDLRPLARNTVPNVAGASALPLAHRLAPQERLAVPLRIFLGSEINGPPPPPSTVATMNRTSTQKGGAKSEAAVKVATVSEARAVYQSILNVPPGSVFASRLGMEGEATMIRKVKESFEPPSMPQAPNYVFGPEIALAGLVIKGERLEFEGTSANFINLTASDLGGSCPVLHVWNAVESRWRRFGKVIHRAHSRLAQQTEHIRLAGLVTRFRLTEEELEVASIDELRLTLELTDGRKMELLPRIEALKIIDGNYLRLYAGGSLDFDFDSPAGIDAADVAYSMLSVTGYYERYGSLIFAKRP